MGPHFVNIHPIYLGLHFELWTLNLDCKYVQRWFLQLKLGRGHWFFWESWLLLLTVVNTIHLNLIANIIASQIGLNLVHFFFVFAVASNQGGYPQWVVCESVSHCTSRVVSLIVISRLITIGTRLVSLVPRPFLWRGEGRVHVSSSMDQWKEFLSCKLCFQNVNVIFWSQLQIWILSGLPTWRSFPCQHWWHNAVMEPCLGWDIHQSLPSCFSHLFTPFTS